MEYQNSYMYREILDEPQAVANLLARETSGVVKLAGILKERDVRFVMIVARGTSDNAAQYAKYLFEYVNGIPVALAAPSIFTLYQARLCLDNTLVIGVSQSGQGADVVEVVRAARDAGALTAAITNNPASALAGAAEYVVLCQAGAELSVAATKTYVTELTALALLSFTWAGREDLLRELDTVPDLISEAFAMNEAVRAAVPRFRYMRECVVAGRGLNYCTALEAALKIKETCCIGTQPYSGADFLHGPITVVEEGFPVFLVAPPGLAFNSTAELAAELRARAAEITTLSSEQSILDLATIPLAVPCTMPEVLSPLIYIAPIQLFSLHLALVRGLNPDKPRGLTKVTSTL